MAAALNHFYTEYGHWPDFTGDGKFLDGARNAELIQVLTAHDAVNNPRRIVFFEARAAAKHGFWSSRLSSGIDPVTHTFLDPWGNPYRIILCTRKDNVIITPYSADQDQEIRASAIVWSLGKDGKQGASENDQISQGSDDIRSWP